jgi:hypothetical protein
MAEARGRLDEIVGWGIVHDVFEAEEASALLAFVGEHAGAINNATFGAFFSSVQRILGKSLILSVARMYEVEKGYPLRSIPAALKHLESQRDALPVNDRQAILLAVRKLQPDHPPMDGISDSVLTQAAVQTFQGRLTELQDVAGSAITTVRNKVIAHHEFVDADTVPQTTYGQIDELIAFAKDFVAMVGRAYTNVVYEGGDGRYSLTSDAERATLCLKRLLSAVGVSRGGEPPGTEER